MAKTLATSSHIDETIRLWDAHTGKHKKTFTAPHARYIRGLAFSPGWKKHLQVAAAMALSVSGMQRQAMKNIHLLGIRNVSIVWRSTRMETLLQVGLPMELLTSGVADTGQYIKTLNGGKKWV